MTSRFGLPAELAELADEYELLDELGRGGSAIVYRARDRTLGRDVAIKVVHPRPTSPDDDPVARLAREARTVAQLQHPGIVTVYAVRRLRSGGLTLVMQLVPGATLKAAIQTGGPLGPQRAEQILRDVAGALAYAHAHQIVHRDVKPENIFLDANSGRALLADFGIARSGEADSLTMTGTAVGTPFYMSPEQVDGKPVDGRSDLYSLGLVAWEMLTGLRPWDGESLYQVIYKQKHDVLPPIEAMRGDVPRRLQYIVERMLQKHPAARWAGADGLIVQLDRTILPADYAHWQAALPGRVERHRAALDAARARSAPRSQTGAGSPAAATVRFASAPVAASRAGAPSGPHDPTLALTTSVPVGPETERSSTPFPASQLTVDPCSGAVDTESDDSAEAVIPSWVPTAPPSVDRPRRWTRRNVGTIGLTVALIVIGGAFVHARTVPDPGTASRSQHGIDGPSRALPGIAADGHSGEHAGAPSGMGPRRGVAMPGLHARFDLIGVGARHVCSLTAAGEARCWGENDASQLGAGTTDARSATPRSVAGVMRYAALAAGNAHTCGVTTVGDVYCWGANDLGQLGDGTAVSRSAPVRVAGDGVYRSVRGGAAHTCAIDHEGGVRCWGDNSLGQLGDGTRTARFVPTTVHLPAGTSVVAVAIGAHHSCALLQDARVVCWGSNVDGQLGVAGVPASDEPREVSGVRASAIGAGDAHTCAALLDGSIQCWGDDPARRAASHADSASSRQRVVLPDHDAVQAVAGGRARSCALTQGGRVWCWGGARGGAPTTAVRFGRGSYVALAASADEICAMTPGRVAECWTGPGPQSPTAATRATPAARVAPLARRKPIHAPMHARRRIHRRSLRS